MPLNCWSRTTIGDYSLFFLADLPYKGAELPSRSRACMGGRRAGGPQWAVRQIEGVGRDAAMPDLKGRPMRFSNLIHKVFVGAALALVPAASFAGVFGSVTNCAAGAAGLHATYLPWRWLSLEPRLLVVWR